MSGIPLQRRDETASGMAALLGGPDVAQMLAVSLNTVHGLVRDRTRYRSDSYDQPLTRAQFKKSSRQPHFYQGSTRGNQVPMRLCLNNLDRGVQL
jgi:hypothetical protein